MPYLGKQPASVPVTADDIPDNSITAAKIVDGGITAADIGADAVGLSELSATGTASTSTFLRGDNAWVAVDTNLVSDNSPQLGGDLDLNSNNITGTGGIPAANLTGTIAAARLDTATTQSASDNSTKIATTAYTDAQVATVVDSAPGTLNTLNELAAALGDDANFSTTVTNSIAAKLPLAGGTMTGNIAHAGDFTLDVGGDILLDADGADVRMLDGGTDYIKFTKDGNNSAIKAQVTDGDLILRGSDGGSQIDALTFDMSSQGDASFNRHVKLSDNGQLVLGDGSDLLIYHDGSHSYISDVGTGDLTIRASNDLRLQSASTEAYLTCNENAGVEIYHNNVKKLETTSTGATVTGYLNVSQTGNASGLQVATSVAAETTAIFQGGGTGAVDVVDVRDSGGNSKFKVQQNGKIGVGHTTPQFGLTLAQGTGDSSKIGWEDGGNNKRASILCSSANDELQFRTGTSDTERMRITSSGQIGMGITPSANTAILTIAAAGNGAVQAGIDFDDTNTGNTYRLYNNSGYLYFRDATAGSTRMMIKDNGYIGINDTAPQARLNTAETGSNWVAIFDKNNTGNSTNFLIRSGASNRGSESLLHLEGNHPDCGGSSTDAEFIVYGDGDVRCDGSYASGGADYAEYFESSTGAALTYGNTVKLNAQGKVVQCGAEETPIGVIRPDSATGVIGNNPMNWNKKYLRDGFGVLILDEDGNDQMNPDFNPDLEYVMREDRPEWNAVGLMGQVPIIKGQPTASNWIKMWEINSTLEMWFIK